MSIKSGMLNQIREFFNDSEIDEDWLISHISVKFDDNSKTVTIMIDNINYQEYQWLKDEI